MPPKVKVNVLVVADQPAQLSSYEAMLRELDENLIQASSGKEALEHLLKNDVAVVLMDVRLPQQGGIELVNTIRRQPRLQRTAIIFISGAGVTDLERLKGYEHGVVDYISDPVVPELLRVKVRVFAELHRKTMQLETLNCELESRVLERTEELASKAEMLLNLNLEMARRNQELDAIVQTAPDIIFSRQRDGSRDYISDRFYEYTGVPTSAATGFGWWDCLHPDDRERGQQRWLDCVETGENYEVEYRMRGKDGNYRWFRTRAVPIRDHNGKVVKWYGTCSDIHDSKLLEQSMRDTALELERMVDERTAALQRLSVRLMTTQDEERRRIARDLHDGLGQELAVAKMVLDKVLQQNSPEAETEACREASELIDRAIQQVRSLSHLLHPPLLDEVGLLSAIRWYLDGLTERSGIETFLDVQPSDFPRLSLDRETAVFRIIQEALTNVFRHSEARKVWVALTQREGATVVTVRDDGKGIGKRIAEQRPDSVGIGIGGMKQRVREFGGELRLTNMFPGTLVELVIPPPRLVEQEECSAQSTADRDQSSEQGSEIALI
jgi:PAS domain S-box-containing protein